MIDLSQIPSNFDNCIFYNAIVKNDNPYDDWELEYVGNFVQNGLESQISEYYRRSENIISKMRELGVDTDETWIEIDEQFIYPIFELLNEDDEAEIEAYKSTQNMLTALEDKYEVN